MVSETAVLPLSNINIIPFETVSGAYNSNETALQFDNVNIIPFETVSGAYNSNEIAVCTMLI